MITELTEKITEVLHDTLEEFNIAGIAIDEIVKNVMKEFSSYDNVCSMANDACNEQIRVLEEENKLLKRDNYEYQKVFACLQYIMKGLKNES